MTESSKGQVEIVTNGINSLVFIDGVHVPRTVAVEVLTEPGEVQQRVRLMFIAEKITYRKAEQAEFATLAKNAHGTPASPKPICQAACPPMRDEYFDQQYGKKINDSLQA